MLGDVKNKAFQNNLLDIKKLKANITKIMLIVVCLSNKPKILLKKKKKILINFIESYQQ